MLFMCIIELRAPAIRAAIICTIYFLAIIFKRRIDHLNSLSIAAVIMLLVNPLELFDLGWQLSFSTLLGILFFSEEISYFFHFLTRFAFLNTKNNKNRLLTVICNKSITVLSMGLGAWLGGAGIIIYNFHFINLLSPLYTLLVLPIFVFSLSVGFLKIFIAMLFPSLTFLIQGIAHVSISFFTDIVNVLAKFRFAEITTGHFNGWVIVLWYACLLTTLFYANSIFKMKFKKIRLYLLIILSFYIILHPYLNKTDFNMQIASIGDGNCILLQSDGENMLIDCGSNSIKNVGNRIIEPNLRHYGIRKIDKVIITSDLSANINGLDAIISRYQPSVIYAPQAFIESKTGSKASYVLKNLINEAKIEVLAMPEKLSLGRIEVMNVAAGSDKFNSDISCNSEDVYCDEGSPLCLVFALFDGFYVIQSGQISPEILKKSQKVCKNSQFEALITHASRAEFDEITREGFEPKCIIFNSRDKLKNQRENKIEERNSNETKLINLAEAGMINLTVKAGKLEIHEYNKSNSHLISGQ